MSIEPDGVSLTTIRWWLRDIPRRDQGWQRRSGLDLSGRPPERPTLKFHSGTSYSRDPKNARADARHGVYVVRGARSGLITLSFPRRLSEARKKLFILPTYVVSGE
jgi:hypothetical protein